MWRTSTSLVSRRIVYENRMQKNIEARGTNFCISFLGGIIAATRALRPTGAGSSGTAASSACILTTLTDPYCRRCAGRSGLRCCTETPKPDAAATRQNASVHLTMASGAG